MLRQLNVSISFIHVVSENMFYEHENDNDVKKLVLIVLAASLGQTSASQHNHHTEVSWTNHNERCKSTHLFGNMLLPVGVENKRKKNHKLMEMAAHCDVRHNFSATFTNLHSLRPKIHKGATRRQDLTPSVETF